MNRNLAETFQHLQQTAANLRKLDGDQKRHAAVMKTLGVVSECQAVHYEIERSR